MKFSIITLFPEVFDDIINSSILKRAQEKGFVEFEIINHRNFGIGKHKIVDDRPYGGGAGMVLKPDVLLDAINYAKKDIEGEIVVLMEPQGEVYSQQIAEEFSSLSHIILVCGHYEGFDERIRSFIDREISIGDFVMTGGEIPAMAIIDSITRLIPGVLKDATATKNESHSLSDDGRILEGPSYTRPEIFEGKSVPDVLLSGDPKKISQFKKKEAIKATREKRPDLVKK